MIRTGLVSITFRKLPPEEIVELVRKAGLAAVEWGGDVHVPHGDIARARAVRKMTEDAGLEVAAYGSYYRVARSEEDGLPFERVLDTALELAAPSIRVWAGVKGSGEADGEYRALIVEETQRIADLARPHGMDIAFEYHGQTLTDTNESARRLLEAVADGHVKTYWQPPVGAAVERCLEGLGMVLPWLVNLHVFHWNAEPRERLALSAGYDRWLRYLRLAKTTGRPHFALLEFVKDDHPDAFAADARTLAELVATA